MIAAPTDLTGRTAIVTGAVGGIGAATAAHFEALGATVYTTDINGDGARHERFDLLDGKDLQECSDWIADVKPDILFNNAALFGMGSILDGGDLEQMDRLFGVNVRGFYAVMQACAKSMVAEGKSGSIINLASQAGHRTKCALMRSALV